MRIVEVGTFQLPLRFLLGALVDDSRQFAASLRGCIPGLVTRKLPDGDETVVIDFPYTESGQRLENIVLDGHLDVPGVGTVRLVMTSLSVCFVVVEIDLPDGANLNLERPNGERLLKGAEGEVSEVLAPAIRTWCKQIADAVPQEYCRPHPPQAMPAARLLWWHRILIDPHPANEPAGTRTYGVEVELDQGECRVGYLFTTTQGLSAELLGDVVDGLMLASQEWLIVDDANRLAADHLMRLGQQRNDQLLSVDAQYEEVLALTKEVSLRSMILDESNRYIANARLRVREAIARAWRIDDEARDLAERINALRDLINLHRERVSNDRDDRRNRLVFVFTGITLVQSVLVWYDFLTEDRTKIASDPRPGIAGVVLVLSLLVLLGVIFYRFVLRWVFRWRRAKRVTQRRVTRAAAVRRAVAQLVPTPRNEVPPATGPATDAPDASPPTPPRHLTPADRE